MRRSRAACAARVERFSSRLTPMLSADPPASTGGCAGLAASIQDALESAIYVSQGERGVAENTWKARLLSWQQYATWAETTGADILGGQDEVGLAYVRHLTDLGRAPATVMNRVAQIRNLYRCWEKLEVGHGDPFARLSLPANQPAARRRLLSQPECWRLLRLRGEEVQAFLSLGLLSGVDARTVTALCWADLADGTAQFRQLSVKARHALKRFYHAQYLADAPPTGPVFPRLRTTGQVDAYLRKLCRRAEVPPQNWLALRQTAGVQAVGTRSLRQVQQQMGYASIRSVHYLDQRRRYEQGEPVVGRTGRSLSLARTEPGRLERDLE